jgi:glycosyltransferase involved in cell wall biosynthesis
MNILHIISSVNPAGGGPIEGIRQLGSALTSEADTIEIASLDAPDAQFLKECTLPVHALGPARLKYRFTKGFVPWLRANRSRYDVVIVNGIWQYQSYGTWLALRKSSTPYVVFPHGMLDPWFKKRYPLKQIKKWMYWPWAEYRVLRDARAVLFTSEEERSLARESFWLYRCNEVVVNYGTSRPMRDVDNDAREFLAQYPELKDKKVLLFMGRIHPKKGCNLLIDSFSKVLRRKSEWHLVIAGPDQVGWKKKLEIRAAQLGVAQRVTWTGMLSGQMKWGALRVAHAFVLPSHQENFGVAVVEALAVGVPVLISNKVNIWREIKADGAGLVSEDTLQGLCDLLESYVQMPADKQQAMGCAATRCFDQRFEVKRAAQTLHRVLVSVA